MKGEERRGPICFCCFLAADRSWFSTMYSIGTKLNVLAPSHYDIWRRVTHLYVLDFDWIQSGLSRWPIKLHLSFQSVCQYQPFFPMLSPLIYHRRFFFHCYLWWQWWQQYYIIPVFNQITGHRSLVMAGEKTHSIGYVQPRKSQQTQTSRYTYSLKSKNVSSINIQGNHL